LHANTASEELSPPAPLSHACRSLQAAQAEAFLFTLPVEVDWKSLDKNMLKVSLF